ncbi:leucine-rich repeat-containing protein kinase family protein [Arcobacteraceae bacterium]|nr:leucine-rich repeat-containing protein kinase family protein [Arcobacteraceae bacterium]
MQTLKQLNNDELQGIKKLTLSENITTFPEKIFDLADTLEILDLSHNQLFFIPDLSRLTKLKIAFFSYNLFTKLPNSFKQCKNLYMLGLKGNQIDTFDENILPLSISWLILTDNKLKTIPDSIGDLVKLQKFALSGNKLNKLPLSMQKCKNLELLRLSANNLTHIPDWLLELPKLSWLAFSGNDCSIKPQVDLEKATLKKLDIQEQLGEGASGIIYKAFCPTLDKDVAVKLFKGAITSDGYAADEMDTYMSIGKHSNLINVIAKIDEDEKLGLILDLIPKSYENLGFPPNFETCTRDTFPSEYSLTSQTIYEIAKHILSASIHLHKKDLMHGDLYAHNILINEHNHCYLGDFGASSFYENKNFEKIEVRAFGCLIDDLLCICSTKDDDYFKMLTTISQICMQKTVKSRPLFQEIKL